MINVTFQHWRYEFPDEVLARYGDPYFSRKEAGQILFDIASREASNQSGHTQSFDPNQNLCANEAFAEAALAGQVDQTVVLSAEITLDSSDWRTRS